MSVDESARVWLRCIWVECRTETFGDCSRCDVLRMHIAHQAIEPLCARGPVPQGHRRLRRVSPSFLSFVELPPKLFLREQRSVVDADLSDALTRNSQIHHQSAVAKQLPARDIVAERTPCHPLRIGAAQIMCARRGE